MCLAVFVVLPSLKSWLARWYSALRSSKQIKLADVALELRDISVPEVATVTPFAVGWSTFPRFWWRTFFRFSNNAEPRQFDSLKQGFSTSLFLPRSGSIYFVECVFSLKNGNCHTVSLGTEHTLFLEQSCPKKWRLS